MSNAFKQITYGILLAAAFVLTAWPQAAWARIFTYKPIDPDAVAQLPPDAANAYQGAITALDHINYDEALEFLAQAIKAAPDSVELRFLAVNIARYRGEMSSGVEAARFFENAIENTQAILADPTLTQNDRARADYILSWLQNQRRTVEERDEGRRTYGMAVAKQYAKEIYKKQDESAEVKAFREAVTALMKPGSAASKATSAAAKALKGLAQIKPSAPGQSGAAPVAGTVPVPPEGQLQGNTTQLEVPGSTDTMTPAGATPGSAADPSTGGGAIPPPPPDMAPANPFGGTDSTTGTTRTTESTTTTTTTTTGMDASNTTGTTATAGMVQGADKPAADVKTKVGPSKFVTPLVGTREPLDMEGPVAANAKAFVDQFIPAFLATWKFEDIQKNLEPGFIEAMPTIPGQDKTIAGKMLFSMVSTAVGPLKEYKGSEGRVDNVQTAEGPVVSGAFHITALFEKGELPIYMEVVQRAGADWKIRDFNVDMVKVNEFSGGTIAKMMGMAPPGGAPMGAPAGAAAPAAPAAPSAPAGAAPAANNPFASSPAPAAAAPAASAPAAAPAAGTTSPPPAENPFK